MIKRPLNARFSKAVREGRKFTTIRDKPWPIGRPIMLYNWSGAAYRSGHVDVAAVEVIDTRPIEIFRAANGAMFYRYSAAHDERLALIWRCEGFASWEDMDAWFSAKMQPGQCFNKHLVRFRLLEGGAP